MSGGTPSSENAEKLAMLDTDDVERLLDEEMKDDTSATPTTPSTCGSDSNASSRAGSRRGSASSSSETAWNFVQMNMTLLPIARPLPVNVTHRLQDTLFGRKPRTPNQKLHHRVLRNASNISPRHHEDNMLRRRGSTSSENGTAASAHAIPRPMVAERQLSAPLSLCGKRKSDHDHYMTSTWQPPSAFYRPDVITSGNASDESRGRSLSEDLSPQDVVTSPMNRQLEGMVLSRSASTSAALTARGALFKDKRILEIQDEERRLVPNERAGLASPTKRSRRS